MLCQRLASISFRKSTLDKPARLAASLASSEAWLWWCLDDALRRGVGTQVSYFVVKPTAYALHKFLLVSCYSGMMSTDLVTGFSFALRGKLSWASFLYFIFCHWQHCPFSAEILADSWEEFFGGCLPLIGFHKGGLPFIKPLLLLVCRPLSASHVFWM